MALTQTSIDVVPTHTMSKQYYLAPEHYQSERERIFFRHWQCIGHVGDLPLTGSYFVADVAGQSLLVVRTSARAVQTFYNVCQHRAHRIACGRGKCERFVCPYHGWTYDLSGCLVGARGISPSVREDIHLPSVRTVVVCGLIFVALCEETPPFAEQFPYLECEIEAARPGLHQMKKVAEYVWSHEANWKVSVENFSECYHCPVVHKYLVANSYTAEDYRIEFKDLLIKHRSKGYRDPKVHGAELLIWFLWPNLAIEIYPLHRCVSVRHFRPTGPRTTDYIYEWFVEDDLPEEHVQAVVDYARIHHETTGAEDAAIVREVQNGLESRGYTSGPLLMTPSPSNESENAVAHIQQLYLRAMGEA